MSDIQRIVESYDLRDVIPGERTRYSKYDLLRCPFHEDDEPSLIVFADGAICKGACGSRYSVIDWVMLSRSLTFREALDYLNNERLEAGEAIEFKHKPSRAKLPTLGPELIARTRNMPAHAVMYWMAYRGVLGAANEFSQVGYFRHSSAYWGGRFSIPIYDKKRILVGLKLRRDDLQGKQGPKYLSWPGMEPQLYLGYEQYIYNAEVVVVCEGEGDSLALLARLDRGWRWVGERYYPSVWAVSGTGGCGTWKDNWTNRLSYAKRIIIAYDNDEAGRYAGARLKAKHLKGAEIFADYKGTKDVTNLINKFGAKSFLSSIL